MPFILAGLAVGALSQLWSSSRNREIAGLKRSLADVEARLAGQENAWREKVFEVEARLDEHETRLNEIPSTGQIVSAMEELLAKTMQSLDRRLTAQADSIELLKTTVSQTDGLLERVLESLDALRQEPAESSHVPGQ
jgi:chromosome segregation ATPase